MLNPDLAPKDKQISHVSSDKTVQIDPIDAPLHGVIQVPGDKSISHRAVLFSAMAQGTSRISGVLDSSDVRSSLSAVRDLGAQTDIQKQQDGSLMCMITGWGDRGPESVKTPIDCGNSGTTVRLLMGILAPWNVSIELTGDDSLRHRPMRRIASPLEKMGATFELTDGETLPLIEKGTISLSAISYELPVASAQLKTAILIAGTRACGKTSVTEPSASRNHTELMLPCFGVPVVVNGNTISVTGPVTLQAFDFSVSGDPSSAAFIICAALLKPGSDVTIENVSLSDTRTGFVRVLRRMGANLDILPSQAFGDEPVGSIHAEFSESLHGCEVFSYEIPSLVDEVPVLALVAAYARDTTIFHQVSELRVKETDRLAAIIEGLEHLGVRAFVDGDDLYVEGNQSPCAKKGTVFNSHNDHRLAMTWALVGLCGKDPVFVKDFESVSVSYPNFLFDMQRLGER